MLYCCVILCLLYLASAEILIHSITSPFSHRGTKSLYCRRSSLLMMDLCSSRSSSDDDLSDKTIGFLGCGKISSAVCRGFAGAAGRYRPKKILVSLRSAEKSATLKAEHPDLVDVMDSNEELVKQSDIIFIGLLPVVARDILPQLVFNESKVVFSMMAAIDYVEIAGLLKLNSSPSVDNLVKTVPLPSTAYRCGPAVMYPPNPRLEAILSVVSTPIVCETEASMKPMISITGHISSFYELMNTSQHFVESHGVDAVTARKFVTSFYSSLAQGSERSLESLEDLSEEAATPGGLNEQSWKHLKGTEHYSLHKESLQIILDRLMGGVKKP